MVHVARLVGDLRGEMSGLFKAVWQFAERLAADPCAMSPLAHLGFGACSPGPGQEGGEGSGQSTGTWTHSGPSVA